jgi:hypothetical protein
MDRAKLEALLKEATLSCYDSEEEFWGIFCMLSGRVSFPLQARVQSGAVTLVGLDEPSSSPQQGVIARVREGDQERTVALAEMEFVDPDPASAEWLAAYQLWLGGSRHAPMGHLE